MASAKGNLGRDRETVLDSGQSQVCSGMLASCASICVLSVCSVW